MSVRTNANSTNNTNSTNKSGEYARIEISGTLESVYVGKKYAYATISAQNTNKSGYSLFKVAYPLDFDFPDDGEHIDVHATVNTFKGEYTLFAK